MKIFFSIFHALEGLKEFNLLNPKDLDVKTGWSKFILYAHRYLTDFGFELVDEPDDADIELFLGQPPLKLFPSISPNIMFSMYESSVLPDVWVDSMNSWDIIVNPSIWGVETFRASGVKTVIVKIPLFITSEFQYQERSIDQWTFLAVGIQLVDRKNLKLIGELFIDNKMPSDAFLILKTRSTFGRQYEMDNWFAPNVHFIQREFNVGEMVELTQSAHVSVNPSSSEGFGLIPCEAMGTGCCTLLSNFSALADLVNLDYNIPIECTEVKSYYQQTPGTIGKPNREDLLQKMLWTYENRERALEMGKSASAFVHTEFSPDKFCNRLSDVLDNMIHRMPRKKLDVPPINYIYEDVAFEQIQRLKAVR